MSKKPSKISQLKDKFEGTMIVRKYQTKKEIEEKKLQREDELEINDKAEKDIKRTQGRHKGINKSRLNKLGLSSHRWGRRREENYVTVTDNIDANTTKRQKTISYGKQLIGFKEMDKLFYNTEIEWVYMTEDNYITQLIYGLDYKTVPRKVMRSGGKVFLDPDQFIRLVKEQEKQLDNKLTISFDRNPARLKNGELSVVVQNLKNINHDYPGKTDEPESHEKTYRRSDYS